MLVCLSVSLCLGLSFYACVCIRLVPFLLRGLLYWWIFTMITFSCSVHSLLLSLFSSLLLLLLLRIRYSNWHEKKKKKNRIRTANASKRTNEWMSDQYSSVRSCNHTHIHSIISQNYTHSLYSLIWRWHTRFLNLVLYLFEDKLYISTIDSKQNRSLIDKVVVLVLPSIVIILSLAFDMEGDVVLLGLMEWNAGVPTTTAATTQFIPLTTGTDMSYEFLTGGVRIHMSNHRLCHEKNKETNEQLS